MNFDRERCNFWRVEPSRCQPWRSHDFRQCERRYLPIDAVGLVLLEARILISLGLATHEVEYGCIGSMRRKVSRVLGAARRTRRNCRGMNKSSIPDCPGSGWFLKWHHWWYFVQLMFLWQVWLAVPQPRFAVHLSLPQPVRQI